MLAPQLEAHFMRVLPARGFRHFSISISIASVASRLVSGQELSCVLCVYTLHLSGHLINDAYVSGHVCPSCSRVGCFHYIHCHLSSWGKRGRGWLLCLLTTDFYELENVYST